jgi:hypothetical protein
MRGTVSAILAVLAGLLILTGCNRKTPSSAQEAGKEQLLPDTAPVPDTTAIAQADTLLQDEAPHLVLSFERTACYGHCPAYIFKAYSNGDATYEGKKHVKRVGIYLASMSEKDLLELHEKAAEIGFFELAGRYPIEGPLIADLPNTITHYVLGERSKKIVNNHLAPEPLGEFEAYLDEMIERLSWQLSVD